MIWLIWPHGTKELLNAMLKSVHNLSFEFSIFGEYCNQHLMSMAMESAHHPTELILKKQVVTLSKEEEHCLTRASPWDAMALEHTPIFLKKNGYLINNNTKAYMWKYTKPFQDKKTQTTKSFYLYYLTYKKT